jgi:hypothetical protein
MWEFVQAGDVDQCSENGVQGYEYNFGIHTNLETRYENRRYKRYNFHNVSYPNEKILFTMEKEYTTSFSLTLIF